MRNNLRLPNVDKAFSNGVRQFIFLIALFFLFVGCATKKYRIGDIPLEAIRMYEPSKEMIDSAPTVFTVDVFQIRKFEENIIVSFEIFEESGKIYFADAIDTAYAFALAKRAGFEIERPSINPKTLDDLIRFKRDAISDLKEKYRDVVARINANEDLGIEKEETRGFKAVEVELRSQISQEKVRLGFLDYNKLLRDFAGGADCAVEAIDIQDLLKRIKKEKLLARINKAWVANPNSSLEIRNGILLITNKKDVLAEVGNQISYIRGQR